MKLEDAELPETPGERTANVNSITILTWLFVCPETIDIYDLRVEIDSLFGVGPFDFIG